MVCDFYHSNLKCPLLRLHNALPDTSKPKPKPKRRTGRSGVTQSEANTSAAVRVSGVPFPPSRPCGSHSVSRRDSDPTIPVSQAYDHTSMVFLLNVANAWS